MAVTYDWYAPYWNYSGGASPNPAGDARGYWVVSYEQNAANMTSTVYVNYRCQIYNSGSYVEVGNMTNTAYIDGTSLGSKTSEVGTTTSGYSFIYQGTNSKVIQHNADGSASFTFQGRSSVAYGNTRYTNPIRIYLPNIAVSPTVSISGAGSSDSNRVTIGNNISIVINNTQGRNTTVTYPGGSTTVNSNTSVSVPIDTSLINSYTNTRIPQGTVTVSNSIGSNSVPCYMYIPDSYKPIINTFNFDGTNSNYTRLIGMYVQGLTTPKFSGTVTYKNGATLGSSKINITNYSNTGSLVFSGNNFTYTASVPFSQNGVHSATSQVTDSRSIPSDVKTADSINVIPYQIPSVSASYIRCDYEGNPDESNGKYMKLTLNYTYYLIWNDSIEINYLILQASGDEEYYESYEADPSQGRSGDISCSYSTSFILDNGKEQTTDTHYVGGKRYYTYNSTTQKYEVIDYTEGAAITGTVYEGKQFALSDSKDIYYKYTDISGTSSLISIRTTPAYTLISRLHGDAGHGVTLGQVATETGFQSYLDSKFHNKLQFIKNNKALDTSASSYIYNIDMNDLYLYGSGLFTVVANANSPTGTNDLLEVMQITTNNGDYVFQEVSIGQGNFGIYRRRKIHSSWEAWNKIITNGSFWISSIEANTTTQTNSTSTWNVPESGTYIIGGVVTLNYYGQSGRELYFKVNAGNTQLTGVGGVINSYAWGKTETYFWVGSLIKDTTVWFSVTNSVSGKTWAFSGGSFYWIRIS